IRERTIDGRYRKARSGKIPGGNIPYGYFVNGQKFLEINETPIPGLSLSPADVVAIHPVSLTSLYQPFA
ncbi:MAG: hypothetical protein ACM3SR_10550, partial [Ignavibacteriales bacterium]